MMRIEVLGCGEAFDSEHGNTAFYLSDARMLIDCGYQIPERIWKRGLSVDSALLTHLHADHFFGLVPLLVREQEEGRKKRFTILGPRGVGRAVEKLMELGYPALSLGFPIRFVELRSGGTVSHAGCRIESAATKHSVLNLAHRLSSKGGRSIGVSGDGLPTPRSVALLLGCDLVFQEAYTPQTSPWLHADLESLMEHYSGCQGKVVLTHVSRRERKNVSRLVRGTGFSLARAGAIYRV